MCIGFLHNNDYCVYDSVDLRCGLSGLNIKAGYNTGVTVTVHLDSLASAPACSLIIPPATAESFIIYTGTARAPTAGGMHKVYLRFSGPGYLGKFAWSQFITTCPPQASLQANWTPTVPVSGDSIDISGCTTAAGDTLVWDLNIAPAHINLNAARKVAIAYNSLHQSGVDTLRVGSMNLLLGHVIAPAGFVILTSRADTNGAMLAEGAYTALATRSGLATNFSLNGGGTLVVGPVTGIRKQGARNEVALEAGLPRLHGDRLCVGSDSRAISHIDVFDVKGNRVRSAVMTNAISIAGVPFGAYLVRAVASGHTQEYRVIVGQ